MKKCLFILILFLIAYASFSQKEKTRHDEVFTLIDVWLDAQRHYDQLPSIVVNLIEDQKVKWSGAYGLANKSTGKEATTETLYSICSISKLFTAVAIMNLYDEGKLSLEDEVGDLLPWYDLNQQFPGSGPITVRSLLSHSSGLPREAVKPYWTWPNFPFPSQEEVRDGLKTQETLYPASTYFQYSNLALTLLGEIIEEISGQSYDDYISKNILKPLGLMDTRTSLPRDKYGEDLAIGYSAIMRDAHREKVNFFQANGIKAAAGFSSNVMDLGKFASWQFRLLEGEEAEILKPSTLKNMQRVHWTDDDFGTTWGLGFSVRKGSNGQKIVGHGGSCPGYRSTLQLNPAEKQAVAVMINAGGTSPAKYADGILSMISALESNWSAPQDSIHNFEDYKGYFNQQPWWSETYISPFGDKLARLYMPSDNPGNSLTFYQHVEGDVFRRIRKDKELGETLTFQRNKNGHVVSFKVHGNFSTKIDP